MKQVAGLSARESPNRPVRHGMTTHYPPNPIVLCLSCRDHTEVTG